MVKHQLLLSKLLIVKIFSIKFLLKLYSSDGYTKVNTNENQNSVSSVIGRLQNFFLLFFQMTFYRENVNDMLRLDVNETIL